MVNGIGLNDEKDPDTKGRYEFPYGDFVDVHRCAVLSAESRAGQYKHYEIENAAAHSAWDDRCEPALGCRHPPRATVADSGHEVRTHNPATHPPWPMPGTGMAPQGRLSGPFQVQCNGRCVSDVSLIARLQLGHSLDHGVAGDINGLHDVVRPDK